MHSLHPGAPTVVIVSGFTAPRRSLSVIRRRLKRDGFNVLAMSLDWQSLTGGMTGFGGPALELSNRVRKLTTEMNVPPEKIFLVAHSAGGLVARYYIQRLGGSQHCRGLMTLATPHRGTWLAVAGFGTHFVVKARCLLQLVPGSGFLRKLNGFPYPENFPLISIYSREDNICPPRCSRLPKGWLKLPEVRTEEMRQLSHSDFLLRKRAYRVILQHLTTFIAPHNEELTQTRTELR